MELGFLARASQLRGVFFSHLHRLGIRTGVGGPAGGLCADLSCGLLDFEKEKRSLSETGSHHPGMETDHPGFLAAMDGGGSVGCLKQPDSFLQRKTMGNHFRLCALGIENFAIQPESMWLHGVIGPGQTNKL